MENANNGEEPIKAVVMGMENAGKSTILDLLTQETPDTPNTPPRMNPTKGVERSSINLFGRKTVVWDFGGQEIYRNDYLKNSEKYFRTVSLFFYVIDIQDYYRLISSVMYFKGVYNLIKKHSPDAKIVFLFHKMDPGYDTSERNSKVKFLEKVEPDLKSDFIRYIMYDTTIFDLHSIRNAFSQETYITA